MPSTSTRFKSGLPAVSRSADSDARQFVAAAPRKGTLPWLMPGVRDDLRKELNVRIPEALMLKLKWLVVQDGCTLQALSEAALEEYVGAALKRLGVTAG